MRPNGWFVLLALLAATPASAQTAGGAPPPASPAAPSDSDSKLPLAAMRHEQPRRDAVEERERALEAPGAQKAQQREDRQEDQLYDDIMRQSAPRATGEGQ
ncbi:MAG TPA: hypothetical protein VE397_08160 [Stellaceae bacterium]|nr:hypothetical protein [Stellaceae bacterium]